MHRRAERRRTGLTLLEGPNAVAEAARAGMELPLAFTTSGDPVTGAKHTIHVTDQVLAKVAGTKTPRGPVATMRIPAPELPEGGPLVVLVGVSDPGNAGTIIRTAAAFGWAVGHIDAVDVWAPKVLRAGAGAHFRTSVVALSGIHHISNRTTVALTVAGGLAADAVTGWPDIAVLVGDEAGGLLPDVVQAADVALTIDMPGGTESLNAAMAAGIAMYALSR